jgi:diguanylate cyclase (GGDEF)-like protein
MGCASLAKAKNPSERFGLTRPILAILALIALLMTLATVTLWWAAGETNRIDNDRTARALVNAVNGEAAKMLSLTSDGAIWDFTADVAYRTGDGSGYMAEAGYQDNSAIGQIYDGVAVVNADGSLEFAAHQGHMTDEDPRDWIGPDLPLLIRDAAENDGASAGLIRSGSRVRIVAVSNILPSSPDELVRFQSRNLPLRYLVFTRPLNSSDVAAIGRALVVQDLSLETRLRHRNQLLVRDENSVRAALQSVSGVTIASLRWQPSAPANRAINRLLPFMIAGLLITIALGAWLLRRSYQAVADINRIASLDSLSELPNRRSLRQMVRRALDQDREVALAFVDLDGFKSINDLYGHGVGDQLIVECAEFIRSITAKRGGAARLGGDEFALFAYGSAANARLEGICEKLLARLAEPFRVGDRTISIGASIGLASRATAGDNESELMRQADVAMYVAKRSGKMRTAWFADMHDDERNEALAIETRLRSALERDEFSLVYQPLINANDGTTVGFETLLRWDSGMTPPIGPDRFIPIAEDTGLIDRIGRFVLEQACRDATTWPEGMVLSVNVSTAQLRNPLFPNMVGTILSTTGFPADRLMLEVTETYIVNDPTLARRVLGALRELGVRVALDDFGSGFASIGFLRQFTFDTLKIDRTLVVDSIGDSAARAMLHSSVAVARALGIQTVAEGIETEAQAVVMRAAGCDMLQGWHFGREADAEHLLFAAAPAKPRREVA